MLYVLVVIYNKACEESLSLTCLQGHAEKIRVIVFDNSTIATENQSWCEKRGYVYFTTNTNIGLSKAYNRVLRTLEKSDHDYIMILDDDTFLPEEYFQEVFQQITEPRYHLLLPIVRAGDLIMSPCKMVLGCEPAEVRDRVQIDLTKISAINSGMVVRLDVYGKISYDETMFLDCVDHDFMNQVRRHNLDICVLKSEIQQNYSLKSNVSIESAAFRFAIQKKDLKAYYKKYDHLLIGYLYILWIAMKLVGKYKDLTFLIPNTKKEGIK